MKQLARLLNTRRRRIVGLMSGTSADGVDAALVEVETLTRPVPGLAWELIDFAHLPYGAAVREEILTVQEDGDREAALENRSELRGPVGEPLQGLGVPGGGGVLARTARLHFLLGHLFADAVEAVVRDAGLALSEVDAVASHGQTVAHFPVLQEARGSRGGTLPGSEAWGRAGPGPGEWVSPATLQLGEPAVIAERTGLPVISSFRARDVAAGGTGAPLVPLIDHLLFGDPVRSRLALNVGGIANLTALPAGGSTESLIAFDTGPGNMVIDALAEMVSGGTELMDRGGARARRGTPDRELVESLLADPFFDRPPPRTAGRDRFGIGYARALRERAPGLSEAALLATATWLTARSIVLAYERFVAPRFPVEEFVVSGGGARNVALLEMLAGALPGIAVLTSDYYGLDVDAKEAVAFALLGHLSLEGEPGNLPAVTGARRPVVLGSLTPGGKG
jgi:anhydro-N-acetylmuramic acid kinase